MAASNFSEVWVLWSGRLYLVWRSGRSLTNLLFLCARNRLRSPTAEQVFASRPGVETASAGLAPDADEQVSAELIEWADLIFVMERAHRAPGFDPGSSAASGPPAGRSARPPSPGGRRV